MKCKMIEESILPITRACHTLGVRRRSFYGWKNRTASTDADIDLRQLLHEIAMEFPKYGYRRMTHSLWRMGRQVNHKKILRLMQEEKLTCRRKKTFKPVTTQSNHGLAVYPNLVKNIDITGPNQVWVGDITYIWLLREFVYLSAIIDLFSRKCVGWSLSRNVDTKLASDALLMAMEERSHFGFSSLIHHSDRGVQYASAAYVQLLVQQGIRISMSSKGNAYDNAYAESFMKTLKVEEVYLKEYETLNDAYNDIKHFIEEVYNKKRLHSGIGYMPPDEYEKEVLNNCIKT